MMTFSVWDIFRNLIEALPWTLFLSVVAFFGGSFVAVILLIIRILKPKTLGLLIAWYVQVFQGTPLLMQLFLTYFGLALIGFETTPLVAAVLCFILYASAYLTETWRSCLESIPKSQWEASASLGLNFYEQLRYVVFPPTFRLSIAPTVGLLVQIIKNTALASVIGFVELTRTAQIITNVTYEPFLVYGIVALIYFAICFPCSLYARNLELRTKISY